MRLFRDHITLNDEAMKNRTFSSYLLALALVLAAFVSIAQESIRLTPAKPVQGEGFGSATSADNGRFAVCAKFSRMVYVFDYRQGQPVEKAKIAGVNALADQNTTKGFGANVILNNEWIFVTAPGARIGAGQNVGSVEVFHLSGEAWKATQLITPPNATSGEKFGASMAMFRDQLVVGAPGTNFSTGAVHVYQPVNGVWEGKSITETLDPAASFGQAVAMNQEWLVIGAPGISIKREDVGGFFIYRKQADGSWLKTQQVNGSREVSLLGSAAAIQNNRLAVTAFGKIVMYEFDGTQWAQTATIAAPVESSSFGSKIQFAEDGNRLLVSCSGKSFLYHNENASWNLKQTYASEASEYGTNPTLGDGFIVVNSPLEGQSFVDGAVYIFPLPGILLPE